MGDMNCKIGMQIKGNTEEVSKGGKILLDLLEDEKLNLGNSGKCCRGKWKRSEGEHRSILDYVIFNGEESTLHEFFIDEEKLLTPYRITKKNRKVIDI